LAPNGHEILTAEVYRLYPSDDSVFPSDSIATKSNASLRQTIRDLIQETLTIHVNGLRFRERNAGTQIDEHMCDAGFSNQIGVDPQTGFVYGGNRNNCGTWMDKMGSSVNAGNKGVPATPRDGSAVELVGLCRCLLDWLVNLPENLYPHKGVEVKSTGELLTWSEWAQKIDANFEKHFWVGQDSDESSLINKRNIYKGKLTFN
jgi:glycogen debranching enzyme